jgi:hypothetical protein
MAMLNQEYEQPSLEVEALHTEFVPVLFASEMAEAQFYKSLLEANNIPVLLESERGSDNAYRAFVKSVPVLVPDSLHDRASDVVAEVERSGASGARCTDEDDAEYEDDFDDSGDDSDLDDDLDDDLDEGFDDDFDDDDDDDLEDDLDEEEEFDG